MLKPTLLLASLTSLILLPGGTLSLSAAPTHTGHEQAVQATFQPMPQPLPLKLGVAIGGLALMGAELWWFLHKPQAK